MYLALLLLPGPDTGFGEWQFRIVSFSFFFSEPHFNLKNFTLQKRKRPCVGQQRDVAGVRSIWTDVKEGEKKTGSEKNVQRHPVGNVHILTSEFHQLWAQWISAAHWLLTAPNSSSLQWLRHIPALSQLSSHPDSSQHKLWISSSAAQTPASCLRSPNSSFRAPQPKLRISSSQHKLRISIVCWIPDLTQVRSLIDSSVPESLLVYWLLLFTSLLIIHWHLADYLAQICTVWISKLISVIDSCTCLCWGTKNCISVSRCTIKLHQNVN